MRYVGAFLLGMAVAHFLTWPPTIVLRPVLVISVVPEKRLVIKQCQRCELIPLAPLEQ